jgi:hypothetical protein
MSELSRSSTDKDVTPEKRLISEFLKRDFTIFEGFDEDIELDQVEQEILEGALSYVRSRFGRQKYILGLAIDFVILAQRLSQVDSRGKRSRLDLDEGKLFSRYELVTERGDVQANTLTLKFGDKEEGIRKIEESVVELFHQLKRPTYPSAYVYNTGQWHKNKELLINCFRLSELGRLQLCKQLVDFGLANMSIADFYGRATPRTALFAEIIQSYERRAKGENAGLVYQALAYGFIKADRPHLSIVTDKVRRGSKRQKQIGDIDCYAGLDLELSVEVKDLDMTESNLVSELNEFIHNITDSKAPGLVFVRSLSNEARSYLRKQGIQAVTEDECLAIVALWDWHKQNSAVLGTLHFLSHIEQKPEAVHRLLAFIKANDPNHDSLIYYQNSDA